MARRTRNPLGGRKGSGGRMQHQRNIALLRRRRDGIRQWLDDEAPYTDADQRHLDPNTPERAYWHHGYQAALDDIIACSRRWSKHPAARTAPPSALGAVRVQPVAGRAEVVEQLAFLLEGGLG